MPLYERYVDDSNQVAFVPDRGARYDREGKRIVIDEKGEREDKERDERLARVLVEIANDIMPCIRMEADWPSRNINIHDKNIILPQPTTKVVNWDGTNLKITSSCPWTLFSLDSQRQIRRTSTIYISTN